MGLNHMTPGRRPSPLPFGERLFSLRGQIAQSFQSDIGCLIGRLGPRLHISSKICSSPKFTRKRSSRGGTC
jgi:ABC-type antimicrobial peptide transport system ATPase subunit